MPSATKSTEHYFAVPEGAIGSDDRVLIFDDVGFTGRTRNACMQLVEKLGAQVSAIVNVVEKSYGEPRDVEVESSAVLGIQGFEPTGEHTCDLKINELLMARLENTKIVHGVRYEPKRSLSTLSQQ